MKPLLLIISVTLFPIVLSAQMLSKSVSDSLDKVMYQKSEAVRKGDKAAIFYFANLLDDTIKIQLYNPSHRNYSKYIWYYLNERALYYLRWETDFKKIKLDTILTKARLLAFLNNDSSNVYYSPFIQKFTDVPLEDFKIKYRLKEKYKEKTEDFNFENFDSLFTKRKKNHDLPHDWIADNIKKGSALKTPAARQFLYKWILGEYYVTAEYSHPEIIFGGILQGLSHFEDRETLDTLLNELEYSTGKLYEQNLFAIQVLTNFDARTRSKDSTLFRAIYNHLLDSLGSLKAMQNYGYGQINIIQSQKNDNRIDYLGLILLNEGTPKFVRYRAYQDMLRFKNPKILAYLAGLFNYSTYRRSFYFGDLLDRERHASAHIIEGLTNMKVELPRFDFYKNKEFPNEWITVTDEKYKGGDYIRLWYKIYWHNHYQDYVWSEEAQIFKNTTGDFGQYNQLEVWFNRLRDRSPDIVLRAFDAILESEEDIEKVEQQIKTAQNSYDDFDWVNQKVLPYGTDKTLIQLLKYTRYCKKNNISYQFAPSTQSLIDTLIQKRLGYSKRYFYENEIAYQLSYDDINALERLAVIYKKYNNSFKSSVERILDIWYHKYWESVIQDEKQMIFYLKKSHFIDSEMGYDYRIQWKKASKKQLSQLKEIYKQTTDKVLISEIRRIFPDLKPRKLEKTLDFKYIFTHLDKFNLDSLYYSDTKLTLDTADYNFIFQQLDRYDGLDTLRLVVGVIERHFNKKMIPYLIKRADDYRTYSNISIPTQIGDFDATFLVADAMIDYLEEFYHIKMPSDNENLKELRDSIGYYHSYLSISGYPKNKYLSGYHWKKRWNSDSTNYQNWAEKLYQNRLLSFQKREDLSSSDFEWLFESPFYNEKYYELIVPLFSKIESCSEMERINFPDIFINERLLHVFQNCNGSLSYKFRKKFKNYSWEVIFPIALKSIQKEERRYQSNSYKALLRYDNTWWHDDYLMQNFKDTIASAFEYQMNTSDNSKCYEDCQRILFYTKNYGQPISQYLENVLKIKEERLRDDILNELLAHWRYKDLKEILPFFPKFPYWGGSYLHNHFDLFIPDFRPDSIATLQKNVASMSETEVYLYYLNAAGLNLDFKDTMATYQKIYRALKFDQYFTSSTVSYRSHFKTLLRFLELHFEDKFSYQTDLELYNRLPSNVLIIRQKEWLNFFESNGWVDESLMQRKSSSELYYEEIEMD